MSWYVYNDNFDDNSIYFFSAVLKLIIFDKKAILYLLGVYIVCMMATRTKSKIFVKTVIARDISTKKENSENVN